jgi:hypothetical protein
MPLHYADSQIGNRAAISIEFPAADGRPFAAADFAAGEMHAEMQLAVTVAAKLHCNEVVFVLSERERLGTSFVRCESLLDAHNFCPRVEVVMPRFVAARVTPGL